MLRFAIDRSQTLLRAIRADGSFSSFRIFSQRLRIPSTFGAAFVDQFGDLPKVGRFDTLALASTHNGKIVGLLRVEGKEEELRISDLGLRIGRAANRLPSAKRDSSQSEIRDPKSAIP